MCLLILCTLILFMNRLALQGGWVCFQFSPLPCPGKRHLQNRTNKIKKKQTIFLLLATMFISLVFMCLTLFFEGFSVTSTYWEPRTNPSFSRLKPTIADHLLVVTVKIKTKNLSSVQNCIHIYKTARIAKIPSSECDTFTQLLHLLSQTTYCILCACAISPTGFGC